MLPSGDALSGLDSERTTMRHAYFAAAAALVLTACATPREECEARIDSNIKGLQQAIEISEGNLARGYALQKDVSPRFRYGFCTNNGNLETCLRNEYVTKTVPVAIDLDKERRKLASAKARLAQEERRRTAALAECAARYPDEA